MTDSTHTHIHTHTHHTHTQAASMTEADVGAVMRELEEEVRRMDMGEAYQEVSLCFKCEAESKGVELIYRF